MSAVPSVAGFQPVLQIDQELPVEFEVQQHEALLLAYVMSLECEAVAGPGAIVELLVGLERPSHAADEC